MTNLQRALCLAIPALVFSGCASTTITSRWVDETYTGKPFETVLVVGAAQERHERLVFEGTFAKVLTERGVGALQSSREIGLDEEPSLERLSALVASTKCDAILITHLVELSAEDVYHPPTYWADNSYYDYYNPWWGSGSRFDAWAGYEGYAPGYMQLHMNLVLETNVYEAASGRLVWSARSETWDPESSSETTRSLADLVIGDMKLRRMLR